MDARAVGQIATLFFILGGFVIFVGAMPLEFFIDVSSPSFDYAPNYPSYFSKEEMDLYNYILQNNISKGEEIWFDFNDATPSYDIVFVSSWSSLFPIFSCKRLAGYSLIGIPYFDYLSWENLEQISYIPYPHVTEAQIINRFSVDTNVSKFSPVFNEKTSIAVWFRDYNTSRNNMTLALSENQVLVSMAFGWSNITLDFDAWGLIGRILTFQAPEIFPSGIVGSLLNAMIALPFWGAIVALVVIVLLELIPF